MIFPVMFPAGFATAGQDAHEHGGFTKHYEESLFEVTRNGLFSVEMVFPGHELRTGANTVDLIIHDKEDRDVVGGEITVTPWMPAMGHGTFEAPVVTEKGGGLYAVENIILTMSGNWELRVGVKKAEAEDTAVFEFRDVPVNRGHEHKMVEAPSDLDLSTEKMTENGTFRVSYTSMVEPIPINRIHAWKLLVKDADGRPVTGATISLDGDMPQHGHGLPTEPEVTEDLGSGEYLVEGVKFSMPGWWVMNFTVRAGDRDDGVAFNLLVAE